MDYWCWDAAAGSFAEGQTMMSEHNPPAEFVVIVRGQWDSALSPNEKQDLALCHFE